MSAFELMFSFFGLLLGLALTAVIARVSRTSGHTRPPFPFILNGLAR